jgi:hypothetical protein
MESTILIAVGIALMVAEVSRGIYKIGFCLWEGLAKLLDIRQGLAT